MGAQGTTGVTSERNGARDDEADVRGKDAAEIVAGLVSRARVAMEHVSRFGQEQVDEVVQAVAWAIIEQGRAEELARRAVEDTGLGRFEDKVVKNQRKTLGALRDLLEPSARSAGVISVDEEQGITEIAKPVGVVGDVTPSTNPAATPANKVMMALKGRNAVVVAPSPKGASTCALLLQYIHAEVDKQMTNELISQVDFVAVTGSANYVRAGQTSGTPNACVSAGNVVSVVDKTANLAEAARKIHESKTFDYGTSCSNDNSVVIEAPVYDAMIEALEREGGYFCDDAERELLQEAMWPGGKRSQKTLCKAPSVIAEEAGLEGQEARDANFFG